MKKILLFSILSWALMACTKDDETSTLAVTPDTPIVFSAAATEVVVLNVTTNQCEWDAICDQSWCKVSQGGTTITVTALPNTETTARTPATITVRAGNAAPVTIKVTQSGSGGGNADATLVVTPADPIQFSAEATETVILNVATNQGPWDAISDQSWCKVIPGGTKIVITALPNILNTPPAPATIRVTAGNAAPVLITVTQLASGYVYMPDDVFRDEMIYLYDTNYDGLLSFAEAAAVNLLNLGDPNLHIHNLTGIEAFVNITSLFINGSNIPTVDLSHNTQLRMIQGSFSSFTSINLHGLDLLESLNLSGTGSLATLDVSQNTNLNYLDVSSCNLTTLDVSHNPNLFNLNCQNNKLTSLNLNGAAKLDMLNCENNKLTTLDASHNALLTNIFAPFNQITSINVNGASALTDLSLNSNKLITLDISHNPTLIHVYCDINQLTSVNLNGATALTDLGVSDNQLTSLDVSQNLNLSYLDCMANPNLTTLYMLTGQTIPIFFKDTPPTNIVFK